MQTLLMPSKNKYSKLGHWIPNILEENIIDIDIDIDIDIVKTSNLCIGCGLSIGAFENKKITS